MPSLVEGRPFTRRIPVFLTIFLMAGFVAGALFLAREPPVSTFDASAHYFRATQISRGEWRAIGVAPGKLGGLLPRKNVAFGRHEIAAGDPAEYSFVEFTAAAVYSPLNYAPQALGLVAGNLLRLDRLAAYRLSALFNLGTYLALMAFAMWLAPDFWPVFAALGLAPEIIRQAASQHPDPINIGLIGLFVALVLRASSRTAVLSRGHLVALASVAVLLAFLKPTASVFLCLLLALPSQSFGGRVRQSGFLVAVLVSNVTALMLWYGPYVGLNIAATHGLEGNPRLQEAVLLAHPSMFAETLAHQLRQLRDLWAQNFGFIAWPLEKSYFDATYLWNPAAMIALALTAAAAVTAPALPRARTRVVCVLAAGTSFCAIVLVMWIVAGKVGTPELVRIQGRYFLAAFLTLGCALPAPWPKTARLWGWTRYVLLACVLGLLFRTLQAVAQHSLA